MKCEACGGDGLIEVGAYRGDESDTTTRECRLCGGVITAPLEKMAHAAVATGASILQIAERLPRLLESTSGSRRVVQVASPTTTNPCYSHSWKERMFADVVEYECEICTQVAIFSRTDGSLVNPADISEIDKLSLSSRTMVRFPRYRNLATEPHFHKYDKSGTAGPRLIAFYCNCGDKVVFSSGGTLMEGRIADEFQRQELSERAYSLMIKT